MEFLYEYGMFLAKAVTIVVAIVAVIIVVLASTVKHKSDKGELRITNLSEELEELKHGLKEELLSKKQFKAYEKQLKAEEKAKDKAADDASTGKVFVIDFKGSIDAAEVASLREEISAILAIAEKGDEVVVNVESGGGMVHGYGLASSQLDRLRQADIPLTVCVDKVAASGGYMMACVANKIYAAPFAIVGSIGVVAQLPNFNRLLKKHEIDYEQHTAGNFKRTLTVFGENSDEGRQKFQEELEETHVLFKAFVGKYRPELDLVKVATGEHWYGQQAIELGLVDAISTSDDVIMSLAAERTVYKMRYQVRKKLADKIAHGASLSVNAIFNRLIEKNRPM
ncbi:MULTISPECIES: protease SohB [Shewanella]|uniref:Peptidase S49 domain protein n=2 Tax=Shewanella TaxID=22 RepID=A9KTQ2_SHEB9|nr:MULTISPECIES: protease SohB [Shewanella]ABX49957.1 Peptidase S49 domain protein [Shewanella baltica OS195]ADT94945.1 Peptidase S49 domain protein [Shewanella baltica OS678]MCI2963554.1 protease SohB [Shewanella sp. N2AIL]MCS6211295.1 protease SohB [Shewanella baltica]MCT7946778.1 protease SohB [Shewanella septentrionalis]